MNAARDRVVEVVALVVSVAFGVGAGCTDDGPPPLSAQAEKGRRVFLEKGTSPCASCHAFADAGSTGEKIGRDLDAMKPSYEQVAKAVRSGVGIMPAQGEVLTDDEIDAVARYVVEAAGRAPR